MPPTPPEIGINLSPEIETNLTPLTDSTNPTTTKPMDEPPAMREAENDDKKGKKKKEKKKATSQGDHRRPPKKQRIKNDATSVNKRRIDELCSSTGSSTTGEKGVKLFLSETSPSSMKYIEANGQPLRVIPPYPYTYRSNSKGRWVGRNLLELMTSEFRALTNAYYRQCIGDGRITVNGSVVDTEYTINKHDIICHTVHRHEPPVRIARVPTATEQPIDVVFEDEDVLAVDKPGGIPVHSSGGYHFNCLYNVLREMLSLTSNSDGNSNSNSNGNINSNSNGNSNNKIHILHRLDRLTSGLTIFAKNKEMANKLSKAIEERRCEKYYLARVKGDFRGNAMSHIPQVNGREEREAAAVYGWWWDKSKPWEDGGTSNLNSSREKSDVEDRNYKSIALEAISSPNTTNWLTLSSPIKPIDLQKGIYTTGPFPLSDSANNDGGVKSARTSFLRLSFDRKSDSSLVLCKPLTGRTHQIRVHLNHLGHPIANDWCYGGEDFFGDQTARKIAEELKDGSLTLHDPATDDEIDKIEGMKQGEEEPFLNFLMRSCVWCRRGGEEKERRQFFETGKFIWLHAFSYEIRIFKSSRKTEIEEESGSNCKDYDESVESVESVEEKKVYTTKWPKWAES